jgi:hypothetical protein
MRRAIAFAFVFWAALAGFIAIDWQRSTPHNRFNEPLPWQLGQDKVEGAAHCATPLK